MVSGSEGVYYIELFSFFVLPSLRSITPGLSFVAVGASCLLCYSDLNYNLITIFPQ